MNHYRPMPPEITIAKSDYLSKITGRDELGLFSTEKINKGTRWKTHLRIEDPDFPDGLVRMSMGGFFNHNSVDPNCRTVWEEKFVYLEALRDIDEGEELTAKYQSYNPEL